MKNEGGIEIMNVKLERNIAIMLTSIIFEVFFVLIKFDKQWNVETSAYLHWKIKI